MDKNRLIGISVFTVILLVLGSQSNALSYQSLKSNVVNDSPLFQTRTQRANNKQQDSINSQYLGMGKNNKLLILPITEETDSLREVISKIRGMSESTFNRFVEYLVLQINSKDGCKGIDVKEFKNELRQVSKSAKNFIVNKDVNSDKRTILYNYIPTICWFPGCYIFDLILFIIIFILFWPPTSLSCIAYLR